jgi:Uma2 family endonuclease
MIVETKRQTVADFDALPEGAYAQLINGEIIVSSPAPLPEHQRVILMMASQFLEFVSRNGLGFVLCSPVDVYFSDDEVYEPDIVFIPRTRIQSLPEKITVVPDLVVEVLSPSNAYHDLVHKKNVYEAHGVKEYWIVDPMEKAIEVFENRDGQFLTIAKARNSGQLRSNVLNGFTLEITTVFP